MDIYREWLWPTPWLFISSLLLIPAVIIVFAPINMSVGIVMAIAMYLAFVLFLVFSTKTVRITDGRFHAGRANIPLEFVGTPEAFTKDEATIQRGQKLDARAWILLKGGIGPVVKLPILDVDDPTPYWLISTRHPAKLLEALNLERAKL